MKNYIAAAKAINKSIKTKHPDWSAKKVYAMTGNILSKRESAN